MNHTLQLSCDGYVGHSWRFSKNGGLRHGHCGRCGEWMGFSYYRKTVMPRSLRKRQQATP